MPDLPKVSVVMAVHNCERYLFDAIESIRAQTFIDFEFIIIDDGSTDRTRDLLSKTTTGDSRVRVIHQEKAGLTKSLNRGITIARGELIARMDADDISLPNRFMKQVTEFELDPNLVLLGSEVELVSEDGIPLGSRNQPMDEWLIRKRLLLGDGGAMTHPVVMFRRTVAMEIGCYDERFATTQDLDLFIRLAERGRIANLPDSLLKWRQHAKSVNRTLSNSWSEMKRMAICNTIDRVGAEKYSEILFPYDETFSFPDNPLDLAHFAAYNGRSESAKVLLIQALSSPELRVEAQKQLRIMRLRDIGRRVKRATRSARNLWDRLGAALR